jgi:hypothetical protein
VGRASWPRIPATGASARALVHGGRGEVRADSVGPHAERERENEGAGVTAWYLAERAREAESEEGRVSKGNRRRQLGPTGQ